METSRARGRWSDVDLALAMGLVIVGALAYGALPEGSVARLVLVAPTLLWAPGYLVLAAAVRTHASGAQRAWQALFAVGLSPAVVALATLLALAVPGGIERPAVVFAVTAASGGAAWVAWRRRRDAPDGYGPRKGASPVDGAP